MRKGILVIVKGEGFAFGVDHQKTLKMLSNLSYPCDVEIRPLGDEDLKLLCGDE